jgi:hypothetical protein
MSRWGQRLTWGTCGLTLALVVATLVLVVAGSAGYADPEESWPVDLAMALSYTPVGAVIAIRRSDNWIGWILCAIGLLTALTAFTGEYGAYALTISNALPAGRWVTWLNTWMWIPPLGLAVFLILLFPSGHLPSMWWRWVARAGAAAIVLASVAVALTPWDVLEPGVPGENPIGVVDDTGKLLPLIAAASALLVVAIVGSLAAIILRSRKAQAQQRLQLKWFAYAAIGFVLTQTISAVYQDTWVPGLIGPVLIPIGVGIAILRYRLYDIDRIISRTIVYVLVTGSLIAIYAGTVFAASTVAVGSSDNLTVAIATLATAAAFRPLLARVRNLVDRRFYRHRYDAQKTIDAFGSRLREETDLDELTDDLVGVVRTTMQPSQVSLWLRGSGAGL